MRRKPKRRTPPPTKAKSRHELERELEVANETLAQAQQEIDQLKDDKDELEYELKKRDRKVTEADERVDVERKAHIKTATEGAQTRDLLASYKRVLENQLKEGTTLTLNGESDD